MPYIKPECRHVLTKYIDPLAIRIGNGSELNYVITKLVHIWLTDRDINYARLNSAIGVLECAKLELYRQVVGNYEDCKQVENGPVSELDEAI